MVIIETPIFTRRIQAILADDEYRLLQAQLVRKPDAGKIIPGSGGLRKLRWSAGGHGKRGGIRVIEDSLRQRPQGISMQGIFFSLYSLANPVARPRGISLATHLTRAVFTTFLFDPPC